MKKGGGSESIIIIGPVCSDLRTPQLRIRPRPCPISGVRAKIILLYIIWSHIKLNMAQKNFTVAAFIEMHLKLST